MKKKTKIKNPSTRISANEINRFVYCPYAWYYHRYYGPKVLRERYSALKQKTSQTESNFKKGLRFHKKYYLQYRVQKVCRLVILLLGIGMLLWMVKRWYY